MTGGGYDAPYRGVRVLDLSQGVAAPHCGMLLAQHGADVVKVEPTDGDWVRGLGIAHGPHSTLSMVYNLGKRSIALDLKNPHGVAVVHRLAQRADVVLESSRPGVADRLGVGYAALKALNPRMIYLSVSGFGQRGPYRERPCTDTVAQAYTGFMSINLGRDGIPHKVDTIIMDAVTGLYAFGAVAAALAGRGDGEGTYLDLSLSGCGAAVQAPKVAEYALEGGQPQLLNSPAGTYRTADGWIAITLTTESHYRKLCAAVGAPELAEDPRFASFADRAANHDALVEALSGRFVTRTTDAWRAGLLANDVLAERILSHGDWLADEQTRATGAAPAVEVPGVGAVPVPLIPGRAGHRGLPPEPGADARGVLSEAGYDAAAIAALAACGAVVLGPD
jgi:crotonobetainyl-CoA:carnitine CoA-transferase CaiB-like acyl-CoA transferase